MIVDDIVSAVRKRLGDSNQQRWSDETLILYTSLCQNDICIHTNFHRLTTDIYLKDGKAVYALPEDCIRVERIEYIWHDCSEGFLPMYSRNNIDDYNTDGYGQRVTYPLALKDNLKYNEIEIIADPDPSKLLGEALADFFGVVVSSDSDGTDTSDCVLENDFGVVAVSEGVGHDGCSPIGCDLEEQFGVTTHVTKYIGEMKVYYSSVPSIMTELSDKLIVPDMWLMAFINYVTGTALQDDNDANNIQRGEQELQKYTRLLAQMLKTSAKDFTTNYKTKMTTKYRRV